MAYGPGAPLPDPYKALLASPSDCIKLLNREGHILEMNVGGLRLMEAERAEQLVGQNWIAFWQGAERLDAEAAFRLALAGQAGRSEGWAPTLGGTLKRWSSLLVRVPEPDRGTDRVLVVSRDVTASHEAARLLGLEQRRNAALIHAVSQIVWRSKDGCKIGGHEDWLQYCGLTDTEATPFQWVSAVHPDDRACVLARVEQGVAEQQAYEISYRLRHRSGEWRWVQDRAVPIRDEAGSVVEWVGLIVDIHDRVKSEADLRDSEERLRLAVQTNHLGVWDRDLIGDTLRWSPELRIILGLPMDAEPSDPLLFSCVHPDDRAAVSHFLDQYRSGCRETLRLKFRLLRSGSGEVRWVVACGRSIADAAGRFVRRIGTCQDVTDSVLAEQKLWHAANHDALTGLANRNLFGALLEAATRTAADSGAAFAVLLLDLDDFKSINDTLGHDVGDLVLRTLATRLRQACPPDVTVARLGGDEFAVLMPGGATAESAAAQAARIADAVNQAVAHADGVIHCAASMGVVVCPSESCLPEDALRNADLALFEAKKAGTGRPAVFSAGMASLLLRRATSLRHVEEALARDAIVPFYQPKIEIATGRIDGFEALLRWNDGQGWRTPGCIAEAFGHPLLAPRLGERMLDAVIADLCRWRAMGLDVGRIAINVSAVEFSTVDVAERLLGRLAAAGLTPADLELEVTESVVLGAQAATVGPALRRLHGQGLPIALDDFGTGFASLTHLRQHPFDWLKIERSFVCDIEADNDAAAIVAAIIGLAHSLGRRVVAEGIETRAQLDALRTGGCDVAQGYLIAKPMPASRVPHFVRTWSGLDRGKAGPLPIAS